MKEKLRPFTQESAHPYESGKFKGRLRIPGAKSLVIEFDKNCCTEYGHDVLTLIGKNGQTLAVRSGSNHWESKNVLRVNGDEVKWNFVARSKGSNWGWKFVAHPQFSFPTLDLTSYSDRTALAVPSLEFARSLLGKQHLIMISCVFTKWHKGLHPLRMEVSHVLC